jgi:hypothetical protein
VGIRVILKEYVLWQQILPLYGVSQRAGRHRWIHVAKEDLRQVEDECGCTRQFCNACRVYDQ